ncbi:heterokaryon incompatibility protein-domain-containing protein [Stachybotrys elegans]|uniref:Heterokaryon incompatibility protein-domain-containing protein n=1 Tax=Stachybotrys elegans TaxID=80388 RepID=A0A8K0SIC1_9HYPO|nr:heterokaryon incompatibility protein-domain-containing protein [Stachybotrys elegans]
MMYPSEALANSPCCGLCPTLFSNSRDANRLILREQVIIHRPYQSLIESANSGCTLCKLLVSIVNSPPAELKDDTLVSIEDAENGAEASISDAVECVFSFEGELLHTIRVTCRIDQKRERFRFVGVSADQDDPAAEKIPPRSLHPKFDSPRTFTKVKHWLRECHSDHQTCNECRLSPAKSDVRPTYLMDLASREDRIFLVHTIAGSGVKYAALSYCWGAEQPHAITLAKLERHIGEGIMVQTLPLTIRDAIAVCKKLDLGLLWVDSICIPQDSPADMEREVAIMGAIYHNAYVVISASSAKSCNDGFLSKEPLMEETINLPFGEHGTVNLIPKMSTKQLFPGERVHGEPLNDRAWAYQESFLARRLLAFTRYEVIWSCGETGGDSGGRRSSYFAQLCLGDSCRIMDTFMGDHRDWGFIITKFFQRKLTFEKDKLPAISSIAELFQHKVGGTCIAGMWLEAIGQLLAWKLPHFHDVVQPTRPSNWRAPSWSYMSIDGPIHFIDLNGSSGRRGSSPTAAYQGFQWTARFAYKPLPDAWPYSHVVGVDLQFSGQLIEIQIGNIVEGTQRLFNVEQPSQQRTFCRTSNADSNCWVVCFDAVSDPVHADIASCYGAISRTGSFWWLPMYHARSSVDSKRSWEDGFRYKEAVLGYALACLPDGRYHRVGFITCIGEEGEPLVEQVEKVPFAKFTFI